MRLIEAIGLRLDNLIKERENFTEYELAKQAGMPRSTVWKIIHPDLTRVKTVKIDTIYQLIDTLGLKLKEFFDDPVFDDISD
ncbi:MAG: helix-turn-helix domain-containing protein [Clostridia bacterium]|jgi:predicted transcriptional regulator|nr:helix-turn-helix domain-containing protein [Clostridia bacterium]